MARKVNQNLEVVENAETKTSIVETEIKKHKTIKCKVFIIFLNTNKDLFLYWYFFDIIY